MRVVCAGHVNWDVTLRLDRLPDTDDEAVVEAERRAGGGSAANVATALARLDAGSAVVGSVGDDERGAKARAELERAGVDCAGLAEAPGRPTATKYLLVGGGGDVAVLGRSGANEAYGVGELPDGALAAADGLHLTGQDPSTAAALAARARASGVPVSVAPGRRLGDRDYASLLRLADVALLNRREADLALVDGGPLDRPGVTVVVTRGAEGAEARTGGEAVDHPGYEVDAVDATGAGDAFAAGFLAVWLDGGELPAALAVANACGALATTRAGARAGFDRAAVRRLAGTDCPAGF
ncbi:MAG: carbohydrate kinase family protein [Halorientalis sp.]